MKRTAVTIVATLLLGAVAAEAPSAFAHAGDAVEASNFETRIVDTPDALGDVQLEVIDLGDRMRLTNPTDTEVVVLGYEGEPYLRVGPDGVFENVRSPATYLNEERIPQGDPVPDSADPEAEPEWHEVDDGDTVAWHDHRVHWMSLDDPPQVADDPGSEHVVIPEWEIDMLVDDEAVAVTGELVWIPGPSPVLWLVLAGVLAAIVIASAFLQKWWVAFTAALVVLLGFDVVHVIGNWSGPNVLIVTVVSWLVAIAALVKLVRADRDGAFWVILAGLLFALFGGLADVVVLTRSQIEFTLGVPLVRAAVAVSLGIGFGLAIGGAVVLRRIPAPEPQTAEPESA